MFRKKIGSQSENNIISRIHSLEKSIQEIQEFQEHTPTTDNQLLDLSHILESVEKSETNKYELENAIISFQNDVMRQIYSMSHNISDIDQDFECVTTNLKKELSQLKSQLSEQKEIIKTLQTMITDYQQQQNIYFKANMLYASIFSFFNSIITVICHVWTKH
jgi:predicted RNase H-like nuclease (RuvC/YqgF family)